MADLITTMLSLAILYLAFGVLVGRYIRAGQREQGKGAENES